jgi:hypothetical protein
MGVSHHPLARPRHGRASDVSRDLGPVPHVFGNSGAVREFDIERFFKASPREKRLSSAGGWE